MHDLITEPPDFACVQKLCPFVEKFTYLMHVSKVTVQNGGLSC